MLETLKKVSHVYRFLAIEKQAAPLLYRCLKPLWYTELEKLKAAETDEIAIQTCLDMTEELQTKDIEFAKYMSAN